MRHLTRWIGLAVALAAASACGSNEGPPDARGVDGAPPGGTFSLTWTLHSTTGDAVACGDVGGINVTLSIASDDAAFGFTDLFGCTSAMGTTRLLVPGLYTIKATLESATGQLAAPTTFMHVETKRQQDTALGAVDFVVDATGGLQFELAADTFTDNCSAGGAGIEGMTLELHDGTDTCEPATFEIAAGANQGASTYVSDCQTLPVAPCIDQDQIITATGLTSGPARLVATGLVGGAACWSGVHLVTVPADQVVRDYGAESLLHDDTTCPMVDAM
jgi:hypothetical protein